MRLPDPEPYSDEKLASVAKKVHEDTIAFLKKMEEVDKYQKEHTSKIMFKESCV